MAKTEIPDSTALDSDELVEALETARTMAEQGSSEQVKNWLMSAASAARRQGRGSRAGEIARAAAGWSNAESVRPAPHLFDIGADDFQDETIVDQKSKFVASEEPEELDITVSKDVVVSERQQKDITARVRRDVTPAVRAKGRVRIALRRDDHEQFAFRVLSDSEQADQGEKEAYLELESGEFSFED